MFVKLNRNTVISDRENLENGKSDSRGTNDKSDDLSQMMFFSGGYPVKVDESLNKADELFVSSMGETGSNELKFFNL